MRSSQDTNIVRSPQKSMVSLLCSPVIVEALSAPSNWRLKNQTGVHVTNSTAALIPVADAVPDQETLALLAPIEEELQTWLDQPLGKVSGDMRITDPMGARLKEHPYIEFINRVQMAASGAKISGTALFNNEGKGFGATITMRDVITNYIYPNTLAVVKITGAELKAALEQTADYLAVVDGQIVFNPALLSQNRNIITTICMKASSIRSILVNPSVSESPAWTLKKSYCDGSRIRDRH